MKTSALVVALAAASLAPSAALAEDAGVPAPHATSQTTQDSYRAATVPDGNTTVGGTAEGAAKTNPEPHTKPKTARHTSKPTE